MRTLGQDIRLRSERLVKSQNPSAAKKQKNGVDLHANATPHKKRLIHDAESWTMLPGKLVRSEGNASTSDIAVDEAYNGFGATFDLFWQIFKRDSIDNNGMDMSATVHYDYKYNNAFWDGKQMVFGDGDGLP
jgi:Zn-dependent metalloprotease